MTRPEECKIKCDFIHCFAGMGMAGAGICFLGGMWWAANCGKFVDEDEKLKEMEGE